MANMGSCMSLDRPRWRESHHEAFEAEWTRSFRQLSKFYQLPGKLAKFLYSLQDRSETGFDRHDNTQWHEEGTRQVRDDQQTAGTRLQERPEERRFPGTGSHRLRLEDNVC